MSVNMTCAPGREAAAAMVAGSSSPSLVVFLDPVNLTIQVPPFPNGPEVLARFCRELAREAARFADLLEGRTGRHALAEGAGDGHQEL